MITSLACGVRTGFWLLAAEEPANDNMYPNVTWLRNLLLQTNKQINRELAPFQRRGGWQGKEKK